jgi:hypothetical protein
MSEANKKARRPPGYKPFWESDEEEVVEQTPKTSKSSYDWSGLKKRLIGEKTAAETATEEIEKLKKKQGY